ncbi:MAG TPA: HAMP domain-containing sensor histidine kinase [Planctomycetaceae bacterium]|jgi:heavy metal sensor kinase|nr:HAMP domain-containing sensor histidine kinase [Planctomycetaceae bacterium]
MFRSIRWTLQMWHAAILATVLVAFGFVAFHLLHLTEYNRIDDDLNRVAFRVGVSLRPVGPPNRPRPDSGGPIGTDLQKLGTALNSGKLADAQQSFAQLQKDVQSQGPGRRSLRADRFRPRDPVGPAAAVGKKAAPREADGQTPRDASARPADVAEANPEPEFFREGPGRGRRLDVRAELTDDLKPLFDEETETPYYYILWHPDGTIFSKSKFAPDDIVLPQLPANRRRPLQRDPPRQRGEFREVARQRLGTNVLVGRSIKSDVAALHEKEWLVVVVGLAVLAAGLLGGHWFSRRAIRPIEAISATAAEISLSNLSRRIDVTGTETELTGLARTLNQMFDRIESAFAQQVRFTADASHELRTPVAVILSHSELALDKQRPAEELRETIETCRRSAVRMRSLIESLLTLARFDSGEVQLDSRAFDLARTVGDGVALVRPLAAQRRITIEADLSPATATGDPDRIAQVVTNLLTNAIRYNHDQGKVMVSLQSTPEEVVLSVSDTGIGIPPEHLAHIFERFYRVDNARSRKDGGVGLGLAICKSIVVAHGGLISVSSHLGRGTKFEVRLPKAGCRPHGTEDVRREPEERRSNVLTAGAIS